MYRWLQKLQNQTFVGNKGIRVSVVWKERMGREDGGGVLKGGSSTFW